MTYGLSAWYEPLLLMWVMELLWWMVWLMMTVEMSMSLMSGWSRKGWEVEGNILAGRTSQSRIRSYARALSSTHKAALR